MTDSVRSPDRRSITAALLLAIDGVPAALLQSLVASGSLRQVARLARMGVLADWQAATPADERGSHWLSAITGHAMPTPVGHAAPHTLLARDLPVSPLWDWADAVGRPCRVLGWPGAIGSPEQAVPGLPTGAVRVAEPRHWPTVNAQGLPLASDRPEPSALCWPGSQRALLQRERVLPDDLPPATLRRLQPWRPLPGRDGEAAEFALERAARRLAAHWLSVLAIGGAWCARPDNALNLLRFDGLAAYAATLRRWVPATEVQPLLQPWLLWLDELLGTLIEELQGAQLDRCHEGRGHGDTVVAVLAETSPRPAALSHGLLLLCAPGVPAGLRLNQPVALADIAPTLACRLALPRPPALQGRDLMTQVAATQGRTMGDDQDLDDNDDGDDTADHDRGLVGRDASRPPPSARPGPRPAGWPAASRPEVRLARQGGDATQPPRSSWLQRLQRLLVPGALDRGLS
ncbi:MAG: hypothetical protein RLY78_2219 [Pseudomonadota bacterium]